MRNLLLFLALYVSSALAETFESFDNFFSVQSEEAIYGSYIVVLKNGLFSLDTVPGFDESYVHARYDAVLGGYNLRNVPDSFITQVLNSGNVAAVYQDARMYAIPVKEFDEARATQVIGATGPWGLDRIDERTGLNGLFNYDGTGRGVTIFIADAGVLSTHTEFTGRYLSCTDYTGEGCSASSKHGTHVAGTALGTTYGVAKGASLVDLKVLKSSGNGSFSDFLRAINDVATLKRANPSAKYVLNASLGGSVFPPVNVAIDALVATGVTVVVAAGNDGKEACDKSPASAAAAFTVGATTRTDARATFSNIGTCVDLFAPGLAILSATNTGNSATDILSGTSMASPHVAGIAAVMLELGYNPLVDLLNVATPNVVTDAGTGSPNLMAFLPRAIVPVTPAPTNSPTTPRPTTAAPTNSPTTAAPTNRPTTPIPTTAAPTNRPTTATPTNSPTSARPTTPAPTNSPTSPPPTSGRTPFPTKPPTPFPTLRPTPRPVQPTTPAPTVPTKPTKPTKQPKATKTPKPTTPAPQPPTFPRPTTLPPTNSPTTRAPQAPSTTAFPTKSPTPFPTLRPTTTFPTTVAPVKTGLFSCFDWIQASFSSVTGFISGLLNPESSESEESEASP